jgi:hypothetical protein
LLVKPSQNTTCAPSLSTSSPAAPQILHDNGQARVEKALPTQVLVPQQHVEAREDLIHVRAGFGDQAVPESEALGRRRLAAGPSRWRERSANAGSASKRARASWYKPFRSDSECSPA